MIKDYALGMKYPFIRKSGLVLRWVRSEVDVGLSLYPIYYTTDLHLKCIKIWKEKGIDLSQTV